MKRKIIRILNTPIEEKLHQFLVPQKVMCSEESGVITVNGDFLGEIEEILLDTPETTIAVVLTEDGFGGNSKNVFEIQNPV